MPLKKNGKYYNFLRKNVIFTKIIEAIRESNSYFF